METRASATAPCNVQSSSPPPSSGAAATLACRKQSSPRPSEAATEQHAIRHPIRGNHDLSEVWHCHCRNVGASGGGGGIATQESKSRRKRATSVAPEYPSDSSRRPRAKKMLRLPTRAQKAIKKPGEAKFHAGETCSLTRSKIRLLQHCKHSTTTSNAAAAAAVKEAPTKGGDGKICR